jgi:hypothetical protein
MPPAEDNTPDFDSMSPEELMAWMETLAERQGAVEGFTTNERVEIAEVDPDSVEDSGPGYIPYGMAEDVWAEKKAKEDAERAERLAARQQSKAEPAQPIAAEPTPAPEPERVAEATPAASGDAPDFDSMTPEEMMAWMETLAERQGAHEGFTTNERVDIAEVDPDSIGDLGPGYIPYGMSEDVWAEKQAKEAAEKAARRTSQQQATPQPAAEAKPEPEPMMALPEFDPSMAEEAPQDIFELPELDLGIDLDASTQLASASDAGMDWLESLAAEQAGGDFPQMDLSGLGGDLDLSGLSEELEPVEEMDVDPVAWLDNLVQDQGDTFDLPSDDSPAEAPMFAATPSEATDLSDDVDPIQWLESLAERQGADPEEFMTPAGLDIPELDDDGGAPQYTDYAVETEGMDESDVRSPSFSAVDTLDDATADDDPAAWLDHLASSKGGDAGAGYEPLEDFAGEDEEAEEEAVASSESQADIMSKLNSAQDVSADEMKGWMDNLLEQGASRTDVTDYIDEDEEEEEALEASIPDWLIEQVGPPPDIAEESATTASEPPPAELLEALATDAETPEATLPDWLQEQAAPTAEADLENLFVETETIPEAQSTTPAAEVIVGDGDTLEIDTSDPWVEAFELERQQELSGEEAPDWYTEKVGIIEGKESAPEPKKATLEDVQLGVETDLPKGEPEALPAWLSEVETPDEGETITTDMPAFIGGDFDSAPTSEIPAWLQEHVESAETTEMPASEDMPAWLQEAQFDPTDTIPEWLIETVSETDETPAFTPPPIDPSKQHMTAPTIPSTPGTPATPVAPSTPPAPVSPAPVTPIDIDVDATLQSAREKLSAGDIDGCLSDYEAVIHVNANLAEVTIEVERLSKDATHKNSAAVHRVLGDALMRQGRLQDALNTYRRALNLL